MTTPQPSLSRSAPGTRSSPDWLANLILTAKTITAAAELGPFPFLKGALGPVVPILEAVQKMTKNRDDFEELCESIVSTVKVLQEKISRHGVDVTSSLQQLCEELEHLLQEIRLKLGQIQVNRKKRVLGLLKEFGKSTSIGDELVKYKVRLEKLRSDFILMSVAQLNISASVSTTKVPPPPITTVCPPPSRMFHGRRDVLDKMHAYFSQDIGERHVCLLYGLGGAGKTQICLKFLTESEKSRFTDMFFLDASTIDTIKSGLKNIALTRSIGSDHDDASRWLASHHDEWLLIFDNADDPSINLFNYFPQSSSGNILITSRNPQLYVHAPDSHHHISDMEEEDAVQLLLASAIKPRTMETESLATDIVKALYCFPLAVVQAGAFIARTGTLKKYLTMFEQNQAQLLSRLPDQTHDKYACSVYTTWDISFKCLGQLAANFLQICSFLHHEGISEAIFSNAARYKLDTLGPTEEQIKGPCEFLNNFLTPAGSWDDLLFIDVTTEIKGYSLINQDPNTDLFSIHPLVHDWSKKTIAAKSSTQEFSAAILAMATMSTRHDPVFLISLLPHINSVLHQDQQLGHKFPYPYQRVYYESGDFEHSQELCVTLLEDRKHTFGSDHPDTLNSMSCLAITYHSLGKLTAAEELKVTVVEKKKQMLGPDHLETLNAMSSLAATYWKQGKSRDAEEINVAVLKKMKEILGTEHPHTLDAMDDLGSTYHSLGKFVEAEELQEVALEKWRQILGPKHPHTLDVMGNLSLTYHSLGKYTAAEELNIAVLEQRKQILGPDHPDTLLAMGNLAIVYGVLGKLQDAEELKVMVLEKRKQILGADHPDTLASMSSLAAAYWQLGKLTDAEALDIAVLDKMKQILGTEHPDTWQAMLSLAATYQKLGKLQEAEKLQVVLLEKRKQMLGHEHPDTLAAMSSLSRTYHDLGKLADAEELSEVVFEKRKQILGTGHPDTLLAMSNLAVTYSQLLKFTEAEELQMVVLEDCKQILGPEHPDTLSAMSNLASTYHKLGKLAEAEELKIILLDKRKQILGPDHPSTLKAMSNLAATYWNLGKFKNAEELDVAVLEKCKQLFGTEDRETLTSMTNLAFTYRDLGKLAEAEHLLLTVLEKKTSLLGPEHQETVNAQENLTNLQQL
ncbi:hypothetical protein C8J57DRAFT_1712128 [Mycena rebaudengoi]|nr:hypothetical protein C8J57DRAFT_1712128 [Mycena rebaudengoi]